MFQYSARPDLLKDRVILVTGAGRGPGAPPPPAPPPPPPPAPPPFITRARTSLPKHSASPPSSQA
ncbi:hypothetical protein OFL47_32445, partial [Pseudomonas aeruginosa]|nr:hypothetical protein [Pseudomonas aeruginosa]